MKKNLVILCIASLLGALPLQKAGAQALDLSLYSGVYTQAFDNLGFSIAETNSSGAAGFLEGEWTCYTNANATSIGIIAAGAPNGASGGIIDSWTNGFIGQFKNYASYYDYIGGTNFTGGESATYQTNEPNRCLGIRQTGGFGDPFAAFVLKLANTTNAHNFALSLDMMNLDKANATRTTIWTVDWGVADPVYLIPTSFYPIARYTNTPANTFHVYHTNIVFPDGTINNVNGQVWLRVITLSPTTGSGNRESFAIDNVGLTWASGSGGCTPISILADPSPVTVFSNATANFTVTVAATSPIYYQWLKDGTPLSDGGNIYGSRAFQLSVNNATSADLGSYSCLVSNDCSGTVYSQTSHVATLTVTNAPTVSISYLHTLVDPTTFVPTNTTTMWQATGLITTFTNTTTGNTASYYLQDGTGGINLFVTGGSSFRPSMGDEVTIIGFLTSFAGNLEIEADLTGAVPANNATLVNILSNNIAAYPAPLFLPWDNLFMGNATNANLSYNYLGSLVLMTNAFFGTNAAKVTGVANTTYIVTNKFGKIGRVIFNGSVDNDLTNRTLPSFAYAIQGPLIATSAGYVVQLSRWSDVVSSNLNIAISRSPTASTITWPAVPLTFSYTVWAASDVTGPYTPLATSLKFTNTAGTYTNINPSDYQFYRVTYP